ncbi:MAG: hypothetical protein OQK46_09050 [Gammaproteobacteria bacterium]|nr:hypothetical protein [Gammaproteobacteria bacterium]
MARVCVSAKDSFDGVTQEFQHWLQPVEQPDYLVHILHETELSTKFPSKALLYLHSLIGDDAKWLSGELQQCLGQIWKADTRLTNDARYIRLIELVHRRGVD